MAFPFSSSDPAIDPHFVVNSGAPAAGGTSQINVDAAEGLFTKFFALPSADVGAAAPAAAPAPPAVAPAYAQPPAVAASARIRYRG